MKWDIYKAKAWALKNGMDHIKGGLFAEGGELVYEAKWGEACDTESNFRELLAEVLCWDTELIDEAVEEVCK